MLYVALARIARLRQWMAREPVPLYPCRRCSKNTPSPQRICRACSTEAYTRMLTDD